MTAPTLNGLSKKAYNPERFWSPNYRFIQIDPLDGGARPARAADAAGRLGIMGGEN
jgi:hypothetical protein